MMVDDLFQLVTLKAIIGKNKIMMVKTDKM